MNEFIGEKTDMVNKILNDSETAMQGITAFLESRLDRIGSADQGVGDLLAGRSMRCVEISWVILQFLAAGNVEKVLDLGISFFDRKYFRVFFEDVISASGEFGAIDIVPFKSERFSDYVDAGLLNEKIKFQQADIRNMPCASDYFDLIFCISMIEHVGFDKVNPAQTDSAFARSDELPEDLPVARSWTEDFRAMEEIARVLKPGGKLLLTVPFGEEQILAEKDSLGLYALELRYDEKRLDRLAGIPGLKLREKKIFVYDRVSGWCDKVQTVPLPRSAVACLEIEKV